MKFKAKMPHERRVARVHETVEAASALGREPDQSLPARIDVDDSNERHDVRSRDRPRELDEVAVHIPHTIPLAATLALAVRRI
jgi:hypothetical protein